MKKFVIGLIVAIVIGNVIALDILFLTNWLRPEKELSSPIPQPKTESTQSATKIDCGLTCKDAIKEATASLTAQVNQLSQTQKEKPASPPPQIVQTSSQKEIYIPLGTGSTQSTTYEDSTSAESYIDTTKYGKIKSVNFEATMRIPTANGTVYAQLFNVTDKHPVWFSEVKTENITATRVTSDTITLDAGNKLYRVQMKSTLGYQAILDFTRIKIVLQ